MYPVTRVCRGLCNKVLGFFIVKLDGRLPGEGKWMAHSCLSLSDLFSCVTLFKGMPVVVAILRCLLDYFFFFCNIHFSQCRHCLRRAKDRKYYQALPHDAMFYEKLIDLGPFIVSQE